MALKVKLVEEYQQLDEKEKFDFMKQIMPDFCRIFEKNPQIMQEMMPLFMESMQSCGFDMKQMMKSMMNFKQ